MIVTLENSFHGRTITTLAATGQEVYHKDFLPLTPGFVYAKANDLNSIKEAVAANQCAAIMIDVYKRQALGCSTSTINKEIAKIKNGLKNSLISEGYIL